VFRVPADSTIATWRTVQPPVLVIEILSPSTASTDRHRKRAAYLAHGVAEVWLVDVDARAIEQWTPQSEFPQLHTAHIGWAPHKGAPELAIQFDVLFASPA
jgi:Uma2 family endonuclease